MSRSVKIEVLAKCQDLVPESGMQSPLDAKQTTVLRINDRQVGDRSNDFQIDTWRDGAALSLTISDETPDDSYAWAIAAQILGIAPKEDRPSDALLRQAWDKASAWGYSQCVVETHGTKLGTAFNAAFAQWLATLPDDPLAADRELLARHLQCGSITIDVERTGIISNESVEIYKTLQRVLGLEVQNVPQ